MPKGRPDKPTLIQDVSEQVISLTDDDDEDIDRSSVFKKQKTWMYNDDTQKVKLYSGKDWELTLEDVLWYFRHPYTRICFTTSIVWLNFAILAEDPMCYSRKESDIIFAGRMWNFAFRHWKNLPTGYAIWRIILIIFVSITGPLIGYFYVHHKFLRDYLKISMFQQYKGTWFTMFCFSAFWALVFVNFYNLTIPKKYRLDDKMGFDEYLFAQLCACACWFLDFYTWSMCLDSMLQDTTKYHAWAPWARSKWVDNTRIIIFWAIFIPSTIVVNCLIWIDTVIWEDFSGSLKSNEIDRAFVAGLIMCLNLMVIVQDWEFPNFDTGLEIDSVKLVGLNVSQLNFTPDWAYKFFHFEITGKWMAYTPMLLGTMIDLNFVMSLIIYKPKDYAQYVGPNNEIWSITDKDEANDPGVKLDYEFRSTNVNITTFETDERLHATFLDTGRGWMIFPMFPILFAVFSFYYIGKFLHKHEITNEGSKSNNLGTSDFDVKESSPGDADRDRGSTTLKGEQPVIVHKTEDIPMPQSTTNTENTDDAIFPLPSHSTNLENIWTNPSNSVLKSDMATSHSAPEKKSSVPAEISSSRSAPVQNISAPAESVEMASNSRPEEVSEEPEKRDPIDDLVLSEEVPPISRVPNKPESPQKTNDSDAKIQVELMVATSELKTDEDNDKQSRNAAVE